MRISSFIPVVAVVALAAACSDESDPAGTPTGTGTGATTTSSGGGGTGGTGPAGGGGTGGTGTGSQCRGELGTGGNTCDPAGHAGPTTPTVVDTFTADIVDLDGNPAANIFGELCGENICLTASADAQGHITVDGGGKTLEDARLLYGDGMGFMKFGASLPDSGDNNYAMGTIHTAALPAAAEGVPFALGQELTSGDVTLGLDADAFIEFDTMLGYCTEQDQNFRSVTVPLQGTVLPGIDEALGLGMMFGLAPIHTHICPAASLTVPNTPGWAAEADVEFYFYGTTLFEDYAPWGGWAKIADGKVSADGNTVSTNDGEGISELGVFAVRLAP